MSFSATDVIRSCDPVIPIGTKRRNVWIVEHRIYTAEYGWSPWECTFDSVAGPYDCASLARHHKPRNRKDWQFRVTRYAATR
jgi:hypothetical protein